MGSTPAGFQEAFRAEYMRDMIHWLAHEISHEFSLCEYFARSCYELSHETGVRVWHDSVTNLLERVGECVGTNNLTNSFLVVVHVWHDPLTLSRTISRTLAYRVRYCVETHTNSHVTHVLLGVSHELSRTGWDTESKHTQTVMSHMYYWECLTNSRVQGEILCRWLKRHSQ